MAQTCSIASYSQASSAVFLPEFERPHFVPLKARVRVMFYMFLSIMFLNKKWENTNLLDKRVTGIS